MLRWAMTSTPSNSTPPALGRPLVSQASLFPACPDASGPQVRTGADLAPIATGSSGSLSGCPSPDCPLANSFEDGAPRQSEERTREAAAMFPAEARAPLVGIARLAANSPVAETKRSSTERPEYFL